MEKIKEFDSTEYHNHHYFLIGTTVTDEQGEIEDPELKMKVLTRFILHLHKNPRYI